MGENGEQRVRSQKTYVMKKKPSHPSEERSIYGCSCTSEERPLVFPVVWKGGVGMVEEREHYYWNERLGMKWEGIKGGYRS